MWQGALKLWSSSSTLPNTSFGCYDITVWESHHSSICLTVWPKSLKFTYIYIYLRGGMFMSFQSLLCARICSRTVCWTEESRYILLVLKISWLKVGKKHATKHCRQSTIIVCIHKMHDAILWLWCGFYIVYSMCMEAGQLPLHKTLYEMSWHGVYTLCWANSAKLTGIELICLWWWYGIGSVQGDIALLGYP